MILNIQWRPWKILTQEGKRTRVHNSVQSSNYPSWWQCRIVEREEEKGPPNSVTKWVSSWINPISMWGSSSKNVLATSDGFQDTFQVRSSMILWSPFSNKTLVFHLWPSCPGPFSNSYCCFPNSFPRGICPSGRTDHLVSREHLVSSPLTMAHMSDGHYTFNSHHNLGDCVSLQEI